MTEVSPNQFLYFTESSVDYLVVTSQDSGNKPIVETVSFDSNIVAGTTASQKKYNYAERFYLKPNKEEICSGDKCAGYRGK